MAAQNYNNHVRYYIPHHFIFYPVTTALLIYCVSQYNHHGTDEKIWMMLGALVFLVAALSFMMRQHYDLTLQNRIVRLEMRVRYFELTGKRLSELETRLSFSQLAALRFAGDEELLPLMERAIAENLQADSIKRSITHWQPDHMRV